MSTDSDAGGDGEMEKINVRVPQSLLAQVDEVWEERGYANKSEFIRDALRDAVRHPDLTRESWKEIAVVEHARRTGESETFTREDIVGDDE